MKKQVCNWWLDVILLIGFLLCFYLDMTGVNLHQWLGLLVTVAALIHLIVHWNWVKAVTERFFRTCNKKNRANYLFDLLIMLGFVVIAETGLLISTWFDLGSILYPVFLDIHIISSIITLLLTVIKLGMHWRWIDSLITRIFGSSTPPVVPVVNDTQVLHRQVANFDRRRFLMLMGFLGAGSLLAISNLVHLPDPQLKSEDRNDDLKVNGGTGDAPKEMVNQEPDSNADWPVEVQQELIPSEQPSVNSPQSTPVVTSVCTVRCSRGCTFPGHCRRYIDENENGRCDLGECI